MIIVRYTDIIHLLVYEYYTTMYNYIRVYFNMILFMEVYTKFRF